MENDIICQICPVDSSVWIGVFLGILGVLVTTGFSLFQILSSTKTTKKISYDITDISERITIAEANVSQNIINMGENLRAENQMSLEQFKQRLKAELAQEKGKRKING